MTNINSDPSQIPEITATPLPAGEAPSSTGEREAVIGELYQTFDRVTTLPLVEVVPSYQEKIVHEDGPSRLPDPFLRRNEDFQGWAQKGVTFLVNTDSQYNLARPDLTLFANGSRSEQDVLVEQLTGKEIVGSIVDYQATAKDATLSESNGHYVFVRDEDEKLDALRLPAHLAATEAEQAMLSTAYRNMRMQMQHTESWLTPELLKEVFGSKMQPATTEDMQTAHAKLEHLIADHPQRIVKYEAAEAARKADYAEYKRSQTLKGKLGKIASKIIGK
jgi:hypothetical protein